MMKFFTVIFLTFMTMAAAAPFTTTSSGLEARTSRAQCQAMISKGQVMETTGRTTGNREMMAKGAALVAQGKTCLAHAS
ncbi:hypothetical protein OIDMADRAFT_20469 [Oidiodendron maius Zn]|uniref:Secreted protein n=1 Tax=Oidiodendron maius (strain Zn) TaxID=913774 RepID=A0A0C3D5P0_OIDMZ|nr:hypothetical protein OIDMADRAFT_20469 [Oidiodendron maius Zn]